MREFVSLDNKEIERRIRARRILRSKAVRACRQLGAAREVRRRAVTELIQRLDQFRLGPDETLPATLTPKQQASLFYRAARTGERPLQLPPHGEWCNAIAELCRSDNTKYRAAGYISYYRGLGDGAVKPPGEMSYEIAVILEGKYPNARRRPHRLAPYVASCCAFTLYQFTGKFPTRNIDAHWDPNGPSPYRERGPFFELVCAALDYCDVEDCNPESYTRYAITAIKKLVDTPN